MVRVLPLGRAALLVAALVRFVPRASPVGLLLGEQVAPREVVGLADQGAVVNLTEGQREAGQAIARDGRQIDA